ncbi:MAG: YpdA family putative bacillithiol disulfide reductase [Bacteroidota bacterium]
MEKYDVIIIGAGPIGIACGIAAKNASLHYLIIEKGALVNSLFHYPVNMQFFSTSERLEIGEVPFMSLHPKPKKQEALEYYRRVVQKFSLNIHYNEQAETSRRNEDETYLLKSSKSEYSTQNIVIATGFYDRPQLLNIPGEDLKKVDHYYTDPHKYAFQKVIVLGAQNSAVDAALETWRKGAEVTMIIRGEEIGQRVKYWVRPDILNRIEEGSIKVYYNSKLVAIREDEADIQTPEKLITIKNDYVIAMTGYLPNFELLEKFGVKISADADKKPFYNEATMETNQPGIYLAGVVCGGMNTHKWFIENSRSHADMIIQDILQKQ